ncbi:DNA topoisomerase I [Planctomicrobium sp. SH668]|uniref:DNA topoisomerase I n=1 Tax=Planctomicrobium sp. SH668 TaxID=3448126 RepID=UPI003F5B4D05
MAAPSSWLGFALSPALKPIARLIVGLIAIPLYRKVRSRLRIRENWDDEFEKDVEQWIRASMVLLLATKNVELIVSHWLAEKHPEIDLQSNWWFAAGRLLLAMGVIESMPDQQLFSLIHPGPKAPRWIPKVGLIENIRRQLPPLLRGLICMHLNRSSPVFAILAVIFSGTIGWIFFALAITQYLIIGLVTSREKAFKVLSNFDDEVSKARQALVEKLDLDHPEKDEQQQKEASRRSEHSQPAN